MYTESLTSLAANATWTGNPRMANSDDTIVGSIASDQAGTIYIEQSYEALAIDPTTAGSANWDISTSYSITANDGKGFSEQVVAPVWRIRYVNGAADQGAFRIHARTVSAGGR